MPSLEIEHRKPILGSEAAMRGSLPNRRKTVPGPNVAAFAAEECSEGSSYLYLFVSMKCRSGFLTSDCS